MLSLKLHSHCNPIILWNNQSQPNYIYPSSHKRNNANINRFSRTFSCHVFVNEKCQTQKAWISNVRHSSCGLFQSKSIELCHECIVRVVEITQICLLKGNSPERVYWIEGNSDIAKAFVCYCNKMADSILSAQWSQSYNLDALPRNDGQQRIIVVRSETMNLEKISLIGRSLKFTSRIAEKILYSG